MCMRMYVYTYIRNSSVLNEQHLTKYVKLTPNKNETSFFRMQTSESSLPLTTTSTTTLSPTSQKHIPFQPRHHTRLLIALLIQFLVSLIAFTLYTLTFTTFHSPSLLFSLTCHAFSLLLSTSFLMVSGRQRQREKKETADGYTQMGVEVLASMVMVSWNW